MKPGGQYRKGAAAERRTIRHFEALGYRGFRFAGSHGEFDVILVSENHVILAQIKSGDATPTAIEIEAIKEFKVPDQVTKMVIRWKNRSRTPETLVL